MNHGAVNSAINSAAAWTTGASKPAAAPSAESRESRPAVLSQIAAPTEDGVRNRRHLRVPRRDVAGFTSQLAIMSRTGVDIAGALQILVRQRRPDAFRGVLEDVEQQVLAGSPLSEALACYPHVFGPTFVASVAAGESAGRLPEVLQQLATLLRGELKLRNSVRAMLAYPVILTVVSFSVLTAMVVFVLPRFEKIFADFDATLPLLTRCLLAISAELHTRIWLWGPVAFAAGAGIYLFQRSPTGRSLRDRVLLNVIGIRDVSQALLIGRVCRLLSMMLQSGVPLIECLRLSRSAVNNTLYQGLFDRLEDGVLNGRGLAAGFVEAPFVPPAAAEMISTAEKTGTLGMVTQILGEHFEEEGESKLREVVALIEPALTIFLGLGVAVLVMSVMLPLFDLSSAVKGR
jgi:type II secretory pathway component PulF